MGGRGDDDDRNIVIFPSSEEVPPALSQTLAKDESVILLVYGDLDGDRPGRKGVALTDKRLLIFNERLEDCFDLANVNNASLRTYINTCVLVLDTAEGPKTPVAFTRARLEDFEKLVTTINNIVVGKVPLDVLRRYLSEEKQYLERRQIESRRLIIRLLGLLKPALPLIAVGIVIAVASRLIGLAPPYLMKILIDDVLSPNGHVDLLPLILVGLLAVNIATTILNTADNYLTTKLNIRVANLLRSVIFQKFQELSLKTYDKFSSGSLFSRIIDDAGRVQMFLTGPFKMMFINSAMIIFIGVALVWLNPSLTLIALLPIPVTVIGSEIYRRLASKYYHRVWRKWSRIISIVSEHINSILLVKSFGREPILRERFEGYLSEFEEANLSAFKFEQKIWPAVGLSFTISNILVWWIGGHQVISGAMSLGSLMAFTSYMWSFYSPIFGLIDNVRNLQMATVAGSRIFEILDIEPDVKEAPDAIPLEIRGDISYNNVWFTYDGIHYALKGVNLKIRRGERVGLVGPSGSGKTTLAKLLLRLYEPQLGTISLDGVDIRKISLESIKRQIAIVLQNPTLFDASIAENIAAGKDKAGPDEIIAAAKSAKAHDFIMRLPEAYDTEVGLYGSRLSGGEKSRIALAAALLKDPAILILDEPTAMLDALTEDEITEELERLTAGRTTIIIAHRLSTLRFVDKIIALDNGKLVEEGTHEELIKRDGLYKKLWDAQLKGLTRTVGVGVDAYAR